MKPSILLVEDNEDDVYFLKRALKRAGITTPVQVVKDGQEAMDYLQGVEAFADRERFPLPSVVLLDLKLPIVDGIEVLKWIRAQPELAALVVVVLTSSHLDTDIHLAYRSGANSFLVKTPASETLAAMMTTMHDYWFRYNQIPPGKTEDPCGQSSFSRPP